MKAGGGDKEKIRAGIEAIKGYPGVGGNFTFAANKHSGLSKADGTVITWKDNKWRLAV
ncbi:hypothetical protein D3C83_328980 [compost metagenome]